MDNKNLTRDLDNALLFGVVAGMANYFQSDVNLFRIVFISLTIISGVLPGVIVYACAVFLLKGNRSIATKSVPHDEG